MKSISARFLELSGFNGDLRRYPDQYCMLKALDVWQASVEERLCELERCASEWPRSAGGTLKTAPGEFFACLRDGAVRHARDYGGCDCLRRASSACACTREGNCGTICEDCLRAGCHLAGHHVCASPPGPTARIE
jgi:hypothetical protein